MDKKKPKRKKIKINFSAEALERLEQQKRDEIAQEKRFRKSDKELADYSKLKDKQEETKLWQWVVERVKKDNVVAKSPTEYDKWVEHILDIAQYEEEDGITSPENGWFRENFLHISSGQIWELQTRKEEENNKVKPNEVNQCAVEFLERLAEWWSHLEEPAEEEIEE